jgi:hypothetical protein
MSFMGGCPTPDYAVTKQETKITTGEWVNAAEAVAQQFKVSRDQDEFAYHL